MLYRALRNINASGTNVTPGQEVELGDEEAKLLLEDGAIEQLDAQSEDQATTTEATTETTDQAPEASATPDPLVDTPAASESSESQNQAPALVVEAPQTVEVKTTEASPKQPTPTDISQTLNEVLGDSAASSQDSPAK